MKRMVAAAALCAAICAGQKARSTADGVYTDAQAARGEEAYTAKCAVCHGGGMQGGPEAPAMFGEEFALSWGGKNAGALFAYLRGSMPPTDRDGISGQKYADIMAAIFRKNDYPAGQAELPADLKTLGGIGIPKGK